MCVSAKLLQSCPTLCDTMDCSSHASVHGDSPGKNTGVGCHALLQGIFLTQESNPLLMSLALAGGFFTTNATWEAPVGTVLANNSKLSCHEQPICIINTHTHIYIHNHKHILVLICICIYTFSSFKFRTFIKYFKTLNLIRKCLVLRFLH